MEESFLSRRTFLAEEPRCVLAEDVLNSSEGGESQVLGVCLCDFVDGS